MALNELDRAQIGTLALCCETWMGFERQALEAGDLLRAADCAERAEKASALAFALVGMWS